jgi:Subtilase family
MSGKIITEGDKLIKADTARQAFTIDGSGAKIGIISSSFNAGKQLDNDIANGELPGKNHPVQILKDLEPGSNGADDEGRALAQVVHDIAPGAKILFHTAAGTAAGKFNLVDEKSYSEAVNSLVNAGANIIVDDAILLTSIFQDGGAAQAAKSAVDKGVVFISAAGNNGKISYQSKYQSDGTTFDFGGKTFEALDFDASKNVDVFQDITTTKDKTNLLPLLTWSEPNGEVHNELEMFLLSSPNLPTSKADNVLAISGIPSPTAIDYPLKGLGYQAAKDQKMYLVIGRELNGSEAPNQVKWISNANGSDRTAKYEYINSNDSETGSSTIFGVSNLNEVITVGATDQNQDFRSGLAMIRDYSSNGSSPILFDREGDTLFDPQLRTKPDIIAPDGISTSVAGFEIFQGTSAAAPHIAGIVALMEQAAGGSDVLAPQQIKEILQNTSLGFQQGMNSHTGLAQADLAVASSQLISGNVSNSMWMGNHPG